MASKKTKLRAATNLGFEMIRNKDYHPYDIEVQLRKIITEYDQDIGDLRSKEGLSLLQTVITNKRIQFLNPLFRSGFWTSLKAAKATDGPLKDKTAEEVCAEVGFKKMEIEMDVHTVWEKSLNQIHLAARKGDLTEVKTMLTFSQDLHHELDSMGCTSLYWAVVGGNLDIVKLLIDLKVDHTKINKRKESLLHIACTVGHAHLLEVLVKDLGMDWTIKDAAKKSPLLRIAENGDDKSLAQLIECGLHKDELGPILPIAGHYGRFEFLKKIIDEYGVDPGSKDDVKKTAFMRACEQNKLKISRYLFMKAVDLNAKDTRNRNAFHMAAEGAGVEMMEFLINATSADELRNLLGQRDKYIGGDLCMLVRGKDNGRDIWHYVEVRRDLMSIFMKRVRSGGNVDMIEYGKLLYSGWGVNPDEETTRAIDQQFEARRTDTTDTPDVTPLHIAVFKEKTDVVEILIEKGSQVNVKDKFGLTPLHLAAMRGNVAIVKKLLDGGATINTLNDQNKTPLDVAIANEHPKIVILCQARQYIPVVNDFCDCVLPSVGERLSEETLQGVENANAHLIAVLRNLTVDINELLFKLGSGPIAEPSEKE